MARPTSVQSKIEARIAKSRDGAFLTRDFSDLGGARQVQRALRKLVTAGQLIRLGYGVYGKTKWNDLAPSPHAVDFPVAAREV